MKTAEEWHSENPCTNINHLNQPGECQRNVTAWVRRIQADALRWAADQLRPWDRDLNKQLDANADFLEMGLPIQELKR